MALYTLATLGDVTQTKPFLLVSCRPRSSRLVHTSTATVVGGSLSNDRRQYLFAIVTHQVRHTVDATLIRRTS
jgi:hypothetical protein